MLKYFSILNKLYSRAMTSLSGKLWLFQRSFSLDICEILLKISISVSRFIGGLAQTSQKLRILLFHLSFLPSDRKQIFHLFPVVWGLFSPIVCKTQIFVPDLPCPACVDWRLCAAVTGGCSDLTAVNLLSARFLQIHSNQVTSLTLKSTTFGKVL